MTHKLYNQNGQKSSVCINLSLTLDDLKNDKLVDVDGIQRMFGVGRAKAYAIMQQAGYVNQGNRKCSSEIALHIERLREQIERSSFSE